MSKTSILEAGKSYTFQNYFEMTYEPDDILAEFGFSLQRHAFELDTPSSELPDAILSLKRDIQRRLPYVSLTSEAARREVLIAPIVLASVLYGAVSTGDIWQFGRLQRQRKLVEQDLNLYRVPADLDDLFHRLTAILS